MGIKDEKFQCYGSSLKSLLFWGEGYKKTIHGGKLPKKEGVQDLDSLLI